jgi:hypothetical protein
MEEINAVAFPRRLDQPVDGPFAITLDVILKEFA